MTDGLCRVTSVLCKDHEAVVTAEGTPYTVTPSDLEALGITGPCDITPETLDALACASERLCCIKKAMDHLSYGDMPSRRLLSKLCKRFDKTLAESVVGLLKDRGYLDDTALAARYADSFYHVRMWGPVRIKSELCGRGFDSRTASEAAAAYEEKDHTENIMNLLEKITPGEFSRRVEYLLKTITQQHPDVPILILDLFPHGEEANYRCDNNLQPENTGAFRQVLHCIVEQFRKRSSASADSEFHLRKVRTSPPPHSAGLPTCFIHGQWGTA